MSQPPPRHPSHTTPSYSLYKKDGGHEELSNFIKELENLKSVVEGMDLTRKMSDSEAKELETFIQKAWDAMIDMLRQTPIKAELLDQLSFERLKNLDPNQLDGHIKSICAHVAATADLNDPNQMNTRNAIQSGLTELSNFQRQVAAMPELKAGSMSKNIVFGAAAVFMGAVVTSLSAALGAGLGSALGIIISGGTLSPLLGAVGMAAGGAIGLLVSAQLGAKIMEQANPLQAQQRRISDSLGQVIAVCEDAKHGIRPNKQTIKRIPQGAPARTDGAPNFKAQL